MTTVVLRKYLIGERIGIGASATVFKARVILSNGSMLPAEPWTLAVKRFHDFTVSDPVFRERALARFVEGATISHPGIVEAFEIGEEQGSLHLVTALAAGRPLTQLFRPRGVPYQGGSRRLIALVALAADALGCAHARGLVHGFVHPNKIVVSPAHDGVKVLGLASARVAGRCGSGPLDAEARYLSPEETGGHRVDSRSDVFRLGTILWELLTGLTLVPDDTEEQTLQALHDWTGLAPGSVASRIPAGIDEILERALQAAPGERFADGAALARALRACLPAR